MNTYVGYNHYLIELENKNIEIRNAKITPKKVGQFVTLWKRNEDGIIVPYDVEDKIDFFIVNVQSGNNTGRFIFPQEVLYEKGILSKEKQGGKLAMRVYPSWDKPESKQAIKTQEWQLKYFSEGAIFVGKISRR